MFSCVAAGAVVVTPTNGLILTASQEGNVGRPPTHPDRFDKSGSFQGAVVELLLLACERYSRDKPDEPEQVNAISFTIKRLFERTG